MPKTKANNRSRKSLKLGKTMKKMDKCYNPATIHGFHRWYIAMFEKLGWMVLAKAKGDMNDKIMSYKKSLQRLENKLECKIHAVHEHDSKMDLEIMLQNVKILLAHAYKEL
jgi:hypothetical protein